MGADEFRISYGRGHLSLALPAAARATVIRKMTLPKLADPARAIASTFERPVGSAPLAELAARPAERLHPDLRHHPARAQPAVPAADDRNADGLGRPARPRSRSWSRPACIARTSATSSPNWSATPGCSHDVRVENHFARDDADHVDLGRTRTRGTPVKIDRRFVEADLRIATGLVEPHFMAGWSGGRKVVAPGVAHHETIRTFHSARFMEDPLAVQCNLVGNPLHEEQLEIVRMLGDVYALNTVIDEDRDLVYVDLRRDHREPSGRGRLRRRSDQRSACRAGSRRSSRRRPAIRSTRPTIRPSRAW